MRIKNRVVSYRGYIAKVELDYSAKGEFKPRVSLYKDGILCSEDYVFFNRVREKDIKLYIDRYIGYLRYKNLN